MVEHLNLAKVNPMTNEEVLSFLTCVANKSSTVNRKRVTVTKVSVPVTDTHCLTVPGTAFLIKKNGKTSITGNCHVNFMSNMIRETFDMKNDADAEVVYNTLKTATEHEIAWGHDNYGDRILGVSCESTEQYNKWLANQRCKVVGLPIIYPGYTSNPYSYLDVKQKGNFFESVVTEYSMSTAVVGWDDF